MKNKVERALALTPNSVAAFAEMENLMGPKELFFVF